jgi:hypothetical protein
MLSNQLTLCSLDELANALAAPTLRIPESLARRLIRQVPKGVPFVKGRSTAACSFKADAVTATQSVSVSALAGSRK